MRVRLMATFGCFLAGCGGGLPDHGPPPTLTGPLLAFDQAAVTSGNAAELPHGFTTPQQTVCAMDTTRGFIAELAQYGIDGSQVKYEWAPIVPGPDAAHTTVGQPQFYVSGSVIDLVRSNLDFRPPHPFGFDTTWDMHVDDPFLSMVSNRPGGDPAYSLHCEIESGLYPEASFGYTPQAGDRVLLKGSWIYDCGHPVYEAEIHPPSFMAFARASGKTTTSLAFANPYRVTQLYGPPDFATAFDDATRYSDSRVLPFVQQLKNEVTLAVLGAIDHFEMRTLVEATKVDPLTWFVCAPTPRPSPSASFTYSYRFVARTGITITTAVRGTSGCLEVHAEQTAKYKPFQPTEMDKDWPWTQISADASSQTGTQLDVRQMIIDALTQMGITKDLTALHADVSPVIETFAPLAPRAGADRDDGTEIVNGADDQPFPFYGRVRVSWN